LAQRFSLYDELTVLENLRFFSEVRGLSADEWRPRSMEILEFVGLLPFVQRRAGHLSGGMRQKLGLAAALVHRPRILLLDEPTTGVDPVTRQDFWQLIIHQVLNERVAVLLTTPYMDEAARCMRMGFMRRGRMLVQGTPAEMRSLLQGRVIELRGDDLPVLRKIAMADKDVEDVHMFGDQMHLRVRAGKIKKVISRLRKKISSGEMSNFELHAGTPQLEDVFISLVAADEEGVYDTR
ncbi:MAG: ABC transporter ATP-binding protein, partial [Anaerolineaceae bacterium]|nr:ABC transporter ATP-binding protein [Anaerolineaceae bacterium]